MEDVHLTSPEDVILVAEKRSFLFRIEKRFQNELDQGVLTVALQQRFLSEKVPLSNTANVRIEETRSRWQIIDSAQRFLVRKEKEALAVYGGLSGVKDENLHGETTYYYTLFPYKPDPPVYHVDRHNRTSAIATSAYNMAGQMYDLLPKMYLRYETIFPDPQDDVSEQDRQRAQLRRFLDLPGSQLDQIYSYAKAALEMCNIQNVDARFLPLLAQWIGWETDYNLEIDRQRNEIRNAPVLYDTIGIIPTAEAFVKRITGWESRTKEYVHNILITNRPERMNLWTYRRANDGTWSGSPDLLSLDFAYEGRPSAALDDQGTLWLFYHTLRKDRWNLWYKTYRTDTGWAQSQPFVSRRIDDKYPTAVPRKGEIWLFWVAYDTEKNMWRLDYRRQEGTGGPWSDIHTLSEVTGDCRNPQAITDNDDGLWLFWLERVGPKWQLKYNRHDGDAWELEAPAVFPSAGNEDPRVEADPFVLLHPTASDQRLWFFWARKEPDPSSGRSCWTVVFRIKEGIDPSVSDWGEIHTTPKDAAASGCDDRCPAALVDKDGNIELFWSSNRDGGWAIWRNTYDLTEEKWGEAEKITSTAYNCRDPLPIVVDDTTLVVYRSNESVKYSTRTYGATETIDNRYAGCTTVDTRNLDKTTLINKFEDFLTYTIQTEEGADTPKHDRYFYNVAGIFAGPGAGETVASVLHKRANLLTSLPAFLPANIRGVVILETDTKTELYGTAMDMLEGSSDEIFDNEGNG
ncbi:MAG: hypothetical protein ACYSWO_06885 [Planctomycetota bacterium]